MWDIQLKDFFRLLYVCLIITLGIILTLMMILVDQYHGHTLRHHRCPNQMVDSSLVSENLCS